MPGVPLRLCSGVSVSRQQLARLWTVALSAELQAGAGADLRGDIVSSAHKGRRPL